MKKVKKILIGVDEAGRGALAGRVFVGLVALPVGKNVFKKTKCPKKLADSKKLSKKERERWFLWITENLPFSYSAVSAKVIDRINISRACNLAAERGIKKLFKKLNLKSCDVKIVTDWGIFPDLKKIPKCRIKTEVKADEKYKVVSLASIVAKVLRDREMENLAKKFKSYGFEKHKGYGTKNHRKKLKKFGLCKAHRKSFTKNLTR